MEHEETQAEAEKEYDKGSERREGENWIKQDKRIGKTQSKQKEECKIINRRQVYVRNAERRKGNTQMKQQNKREKGKRMWRYSAEKTGIVEERTNRKITLAEQHLFSPSCNNPALHTEMGSYLQLGAWALGYVSNEGANLER